MSDMTARERIISEVICINEFGTMKDSQLREAVDDIIAIVREALLSEAAVEANGDGWLEKSMEYWSATGKYSASEKATEAFRNGLVNALDAAFGPASD